MSEARGEMKAGRQGRQFRGLAREKILRCLLLLGCVSLFVGGCATTRDPYEGLGVEDFWNGGVAAFDSEDWSKAIDYFTRMIETNAAHPNVPDARLYKAQAYEAREEFILAIGEYQLFLDVYFSNPRAAEASLGICRSYVELSPIPQRDQTDTERARDACGRTAIEFQGLTVGEEAEAYRKEMVARLAERAYQNADFYRNRGQLLSAVDMFDEVAERHWDTAWAPAAILARHRIYVELEWTEEAEEEALRLEFNYPDSPEAQLLKGEGSTPVTGAAAP
jgi:outer membrane protein assembly factor BamD